MKNRRGFLTALTAASSACLVLAMNASDEAQTPPSPSPHAPHEPTPRPPSVAALAIATTFRAFDPHLSDVELATIARNIDANRAAAATLGAKHKPLKNGDDLAVRFSAAESI